MLLERIELFVAALRENGLEISVGEVMDGALAAGHIDLLQREALWSALSSTLIKDHGHQEAFNLLFECYFPVSFANSNTLPRAGPAFEEPFESESRPEADLSPQGLMAAMEELAKANDARLLEAIASAAVEAYAGIDPGRPVGARYYLYRTLRTLNLDAIVSLLSGSGHLEEDGSDQNNDADLDDAFAKALRASVLRSAAAEIEHEIEAEIKRLLVAANGSEAVAKLSRRPLPENIDFSHATAEELTLMRRSLSPLAAHLASRLTLRRRSRRRGTVDIRSTLRHSLAYGGVPVDIKYRHRHPAKPELWILADISGSVSSFARFTLALVHALSSQFSKVRSFVFVDDIDEVTNLFSDANDFAEALEKISSEANVVWMDGNSHYGHVLESFCSKWADELGPRTTVIVLGDARGNYHDAGIGSLGEVSSRCKKLYWLNPEPSGYWDTGDSVMSRYAPLCDGVYECRNLRQLQKFVELLA